MVVPLFLAVAQALVGPNAVRRELAAGEKNAVLMAPPEAVCGGEAEELTWTADGNYLLVTRRVTNLGVGDLAAAVSGKPTKELTARRELVVWSLRSRQARTAFSMGADEGLFDAGETMAGTDRVLVHYTRRVRGENGGPDRNVDGYSMLAASSGNLIPMTQNLGGDPAVEAVRMSPSQPMGALRILNSVDKTATMRFFGPDGRLGASVTLPQKKQFFYDRSGMPGYLASVEKGSIRFQAIDPSSGKLGGITELKTLDEITFGSQSESDLSVERVTGSVPTNAPAPGLLLKVKGGKTEEAGIVSTDGSIGVVSPRNDAVAYIGQGNVFVRSLARVSRQAYEATMVAARKALAMSDAKQVALGLMMFALDMDDAYPNPGDYTKVNPYLKDRSLMDSFTYTFGGGKMSDIAKPADTEIGYVSGPGGRAVAYADGHVRWVPNAP